MKTPRTKTAATLIALFLVLTIAVTFVALPVADAHTPAWTITTGVYASIAPNPIGVNQQAAIVFWCDYVPPTAVGGYGDRWSFTVEVTKPDASKETLGPIRSDPVGNGYVQYTPTQVGTYSVVVKMAEQVITGLPIPPGQTINTITGAAYVNDTYKASTSETVSFVVQQDPVATWPASPLPTGYWSRPIEGQNREWWTISGNWFSANGYNQSSQAYYYKGGGFNPYTVGPTSAHIVWAKPYEMFGGLMGGELSIDGGVGSYYTGMSYEQAFEPPVIMQGRLYYNTPPSAKPYYGTHCVDLRTGEEIWYQNITINYGQIYNYISPNQFGGIPYLWRAAGTTYKMYDAYTGNWILDLVNATGGGTIAYGADGSLLLYFYSGAQNRLYMWNSSLAIWANMPNLWSGNNYWLWRPPAGRTDLDWRKGIQWNVSVTDVPGTPSLARLNSEMAICRTLFTEVGGTTKVQDVAYSVKKGQEGNLLWGPINRTRASHQLLGLPVGGASILTDGVYTDYIGETMEWYGYDAYTGQQLWGPTKSTSNAWAMYGGYRTLFGAFGKIYQVGMDGCVHCLDVKTGKKLWSFNTSSSGFESGYPNWPLLSGGFLGGAPDTGGLKVYAVGGHTHLQPLYRGARLYCLDGETGDLLWDIAGWYQAGAPVGADGYMAAVNGYDMQLYCFGKGQTATTVAASPKVSVHGSSVLIEGTVTDQSPGAKNTPAIADESMSAWMEYLYMQKECPANVEGVEVSLDTLDPNGNFVHIGTATSYAGGMFKKAFVPEVPGEYTIIATFAGSKSYYTSYAETAISVDPAPPATAPPEYPQPVDPTMTIVGGVIAMIIAVAVATLLILRKK